MENWCCILGVAALSLSLVNLVLRIDGQFTAEESDSALPIPVSPGTSSQMQVLRLQLRPAISETVHGYTLHRFRCVTLQPSRQVWWWCVYVCSVVPNSATPWTI